MNRRVRGVSARTVYSNTPETDLLPTVLHRVCVLVDGQDVEVVLQATDPINALDLVNAMSPEQILALPRMKEEAA